MEVDINGIWRQIQGVAWRLEKEIIDRLRKLYTPYDSCLNDDLQQIEKDITDEAEELDFIGDMLANGTDEERK